MEGFYSAPRRFWASGLIFFTLLILISSCRSSQSGSTEGRRFIVRMKDGSPFTDSYSDFNNSARYQALMLQSSELSQMVSLQMAKHKSYIKDTAGQNAVIKELRYNTFTVEFSEEADVSASVEALKRQHEIQYIEPDFQVRAHYTPNDPQVQQQWAHSVVKSYDAWDLERGSSEIIVAVIDTGVDYTHPDLAANMWRNSGETAGNNRDDDNNGITDDVYGADFANNDGNPMADDSPNFHGTHVAGTIGAVGNNNVGVAGHALNVKLMALKFLRNDGYGNVSDAIRCIDYAIAKGAHILSNSWGGPQSSQEMQAAINRARAAGILFIAAAGNGGQDGVGDNNDQYPNFPSNYSPDNVVAVAATTQSDTLTSFSNFGSATVDVAAPGQGILSTKNGGGYHSLSGTSMATPLVSGVAALVWSRNRNLSYLQVKQILINSSDRVSALNNRVVADGRINAEAAVAMANNPPNPQPDPNPDPNPDPGPNPSPPPTGNIAPQPLIAGQTDITVNNPFMQIPIQYNVAGFPGAVGAYLEMSQPNGSFINPNGYYPDPSRLLYGIQGGVQGYFVLYPQTQLPAWASYQIRIIPLNAFHQAVGLFSSPSTLRMVP